MRTLITLSLIAASLIPAAAPAQTRELWRDRQDIREERRDLNQAYRYGDARDIRNERRDLREARQEYREDVRDYRRDYRRDDWRGWRGGHRDLYRRGGFRHDFGYNGFRSGGRIDRGFYAQRYVIADPGRYHLPRAYGADRWVRHYDDVLLIDTRRGIVRDVIRGFYW